MRERRSATGDDDGVGGGELTFVAARFRAQLLHQRAQSAGLDLLAARNKGLFTGPPRIVLTGENLWGNLIAPPSGTSHTGQYHLLLGTLGVAHVYDDAVPAPHSWNATWTARALELLMGIVK